MSIVNWNAAFELTPAGDDSPDTIDDRIREFKENLRYRLDKEHNFDFADASADQGWHTMGSAKIYVGTSEPTKRPDGTTDLDTDDTGRLLLRTDEDNSLYVWGGSSWVLIVDNTQSVNTTSDVEFNSVTAGTFTVTGFSGSVGVSDSISGNDITRNEIFDAMDSYIPNTNDEMVVWGLIGDKTGDDVYLYYPSVATRISANTIWIDVVRVITHGPAGTMIMSPITLSFVDGNTSTFDGASLCW